ncbi:MAG TPA: hypothetical protein VF853_05660 [Candidatus Deferrimicrobiaceae bacterium]
MPTTREFSPHRILPLILTIPLLLLLGAGGVLRPCDPVPFSCAVVPNQFERHDLPARWGDDFIQDALPAPSLADDETSRRLRVARVVLEGRPTTAAPFLRPGWEKALFSALESLTDSLLLSRPPPSSPSQA